MESHSEADVASLLVELLVSFGNAIGRGPYFQVEATKHFLNLFVVIVGSTSKFRKGTSWARIQQVFEQVDPDWVKRVKGGLVTGEGFVYEIRDPVELVASETNPRKGGKPLLDPGVKDKRLCCLVEEIVAPLRLMRRDGNILSERLREAWDGRPIGSMTKNNRATCREPHVSLIGHITVEELRKNLSSTDMANGFGNRFLWLMVTRSRLLPHGSSYNPDAEMIEELRRCVEFGRKAGRIKWSSDCLEAWSLAYQELSQERFGFVESLLARAKAQVLRLSCIYALLDRSTLIHNCHLEAALALWAYCDASVRHIFQENTGNPIADKILCFLASRAPMGVTRTAISDLFCGHVKSAEINKAKEALDGLVEVVTAPSGGRSTEIWRLIPGELEALYRNEPLDRFGGEF